MNVSDIIAVPMRKGTAYITTVALWIAVLYAPLFHLHVQEVGESPFIHAHFSESHDSDAESVTHMESEHSGGDVRSVDVFTATGTHAFHFAAPISSCAVNLSNPGVCVGFVVLTASRAHAPPELPFRIPRAPPVQPS